MASCRKHVGKGLVTFACQLEAEHDGPCEAHEVPRSVTERRLWAEGQAKQSRQPESSGSDESAPGEPPAPPSAPQPQSAPTKQREGDQRLPDEVNQAEREEMLGNFQIIVDYLNSTREWKWVPPDVAMAEARLRNWLES